MRRACGVTALAIVVAGCSRSGAIAAPGWQPRFGPVIDEEIVVGRVAGRDRVSLLTSKDTLVVIDLAQAKHARIPLQRLRPGEHPWGLASTGRKDDGFWTLTGREELAHISDEGVVDRRLPLNEPHVALYSGLGELVYQAVNMLPPADALAAGPPGAAPRKRWSDMRTRVFALQRVQAAVLNLVACGVSEHDVVPCWFSDQANVTLTSAGGTSTHAALEGIAAADPQALVEAQLPRRPIGDAWMSAAGDLWALTSGEPSRPDLADRRGSWTIGRYRADGTVLRRVPLDQPARLILRISGPVATLLAWDGRVVQVQP